MRNLMVRKIVPRKLYPLYGIALYFSNNLTYVVRCGWIPQSYTVTGIL